MASSMEASFLAADIDGGAGHPLQGHRQPLHGSHGDLGEVDGSIVDLGTRASTEVNAPVMEPADDATAAAAADKAKGKFTAGDGATAASADKAKGKFTMSEFAASADFASADVVPTGLPLGGVFMATVDASIVADAAMSSPPKETKMIMTTTGTTPFTERNLVLSAPV